MRASRFTLPPAFALAALLAAAPAAHAQLFDFESTPAFTPAPFSVTVGGLTAQFGTLGAGPTVVVPVGALPAPVVTLSGNVFANVGTDLFGAILSAPRTGVSLNFAVSPGSTLTLVPFSAGVPLVGSAVSSAGAVPPGGVVNEGTLSLSGVTFDMIGLVASGAPGAGVTITAIDDVAFSATTTPEPSTASLLAGSALALGLLARRRRVS